MVDPLPEQNLKQEITHLNAQGLSYLEIDPQVGLGLVQKAIDCNQGQDKQAGIYPDELANSYLLSGRLNLSIGSYANAMQSFTYALNLYTQLKDLEKSVQTRSYIGITFASMGDFAQGLENLFAALKDSHDCHNPVIEAEITNDISYAYVLLGQPEMALPHLQQCIQIFREHGLDQQLGWTLDSLAMAYLNTGNPQGALQAELECIDLARKMLDWVDVASYSTSAGNIYLRLDNHAAARKMFKHALDVTREHHYRADLGKALLAMGKLEAQDGNIPAALKCLEEALGLSSETESVLLMQDCCRTLSGVYEQAGDMAQALDHYKQFHAASEKIFNEDADKRIKNIQVLHQMDTIRHEADTFYMQTVELKEEIEEQRRVQTVLERLARVDALTGLLNRYAFYESGEKVFEKAQHSGADLGVIMMDIDLFKGVNDQYGHLVGDQVLSVVADRARHHLRSSDMIARYGGDEFVLLLSETSAGQVLETAERLRVAICKTPILVSRDMIKTSVSVGIAILDKNTQHHKLQELVAAADHALYQAKQSGRNVVKVYKGQSLTATDFQT
jgi:diguanylate cyclase (GGDEF)-like protein